MGSSPSPHPGESHHIKKGAWTIDEDRRLVTYIQCHGIGCWPSVPKAAGLFRSGKSCRLRWINYLSPSIKRGNFSDDEENIIIILHSLLGNRWSAIASNLPGRTDNEVRNYWNSHIRKKLLKRGTDPLYLFPSELIAEKEEKLKSPAGSTSNEEESDGSDQEFSDWEKLFLMKPALDTDFLSVFREHQNVPADGSWTLDLITGFPPSSTYAPIPEDLQNEGKVVLQLDSDNDATENETIVAAVDTNDAGVEQSNTTPSVTSLNDTCVTKSPHTDYITTKICISLEVLKQHFGMNLEDAAKSLGISRSSLKRMCRENGIERWPSRKRKKINRHPSNLKKENNKLVRVCEEQNKESNVRHCFDSPPKQATNVVHTVPHVTPLQDASSVTIKATYEDDIIKFQLPLSSGMDDLREKVAKRLNLEVGTFKLKHNDDAGDLVLITCDEDLKDCVGRCRSLDKATIDMLVLLISYQSK